ncbi:MAG: alpha/beta hydrolase [Candidatus Onthomonas sp.]
MHHSFLRITWTRPRGQHSVPLRVKALRRQWAKSDARRDQGLTTPEQVLRQDDLSYGENGVWSLLDLYRPKEAEGPLPVIVSIHGGGYFYGSKEVYQHYCMDLARRGFAVVNFNYRLAPEFRYPAPLEDTNAVLTWLCAHGEEYQIDLNNVFLVGDSAGAQLASQYAAAWANPDYAKLLGLEIPAFRLGAVGLNCGMYRLDDWMLESSLAPMAKDYLGPDPTVYGKQLDVLGHIGANYPPAYLVSAPNDFLAPQCQPMAVFLQEKGVEAQWKLYGTLERQEVGHVFHCNLRLPEAQQANDEETAFFRKHIQ